MSFSTKIITPKILLFFLSIGFLTNVSAQTSTKIKGKVLDNKSGETIPFVSVSVVGTKFGTQTDFNGNYFIETREEKITLRFSLVGYAPEVRTVEAGKPQVLNVRLKLQTNALEGVTVKQKKERYRNKNNPAVTLIEKVIANKNKNRKEAFDYYQYNKYEKLEFDLSNISEKFKNRKFMKKFDFVFNHLDTSAISGKVNLPMYLKEQSSDVYFRQNPTSKKEVINGEKITSIGRYMDTNGIKTYLEALYQDINVYDNNIFLLANQFLGPAAPVSPQFYQYAIIDTVMFKGTKCVNLGFSPRNREDLLFQGMLYISLDADSSFAIRRVQMGFSKDVNINFVTDLRITQEFANVDGSGQMLTKDELAIEFNIMKNENGMGVFGQRSVSYKDYVINKPIDNKVFAGYRIQEAPDFKEKNSTFWQNARHDSLTTKEFGIYTMVDSIKKVPAFQRIMNTASFLLEGYKPIGFFEIGPVSTFYGFNPVEGFRARVGGRTVYNAFNERFGFSTYAAYGTKDQRWKYFGSATVSLTNHDIYSFPMKTIKVSYQDDAKFPGQDLLFVNEDNVLLSFKRGQNDKMTYDKIWQLDYLNESKSGFSVNLNFKNRHQAPAGSLKFKTIENAEGKADSTQDIVSSEVQLALRYAPHETFYQGKGYRIPIVNNYPIFEVRYLTGIKGLMGGQYNYSRLTGFITKRVFIPPIGYNDVTIEAGKTFGQVPFQLLSIHRANTSYAFQFESYNMMNFLEFVSDHYASIALNHNFNGFFFNKIPLIKKLKLREVISFKSLWGGLSEENTPSATNHLYQLPTDAAGHPTTYTLGSKPYMEASFGVANIFKVLRVDLVKRLTYLDNVNVPQGYAVRFRMKFDF